MQREYAGFWLRTIAILIDSIVLWLISTALGLLGLLVMLPGGRIVIDQTSNSYDFFYSRVTHNPLITFLLVGGWFVVWLTYYGLFESSAAQATPGKQILGLIVTDCSGNKISFWHSVGRNAGKIVSSLLFHLGYLMAAFTAKKQALHDIMSRCLVVKKNAYVNSSTGATT